MPLIRVSLRKGKSDAYKQAIFDGVYQAMRDMFDVPEDDQFMTLSEHDSADFRYSATYLDVPRSEDVVFIQITANNTRSLEQKKAFYKRMADLLGDNPGLRSEDLLISLVEVSKENWSLGYGLAQYA
ncbi:MAG: tautomerase family protein [Pseudomonadota bacterium]